MSRPPFPLRASAPPFAGQEGKGVLGREGLGRGMGGKDGAAGEVGYEGGHRWGGAGGADVRNQAIIHYCLL